MYISEFILNRPKILEDVKELMEKYNCNEAIVPFKNLEEMVIVLRRDKVPILYLEYQLWPEIKRKVKKEYNWTIREIAKIIRELPFSVFYEDLKPEKDYEFAIPLLQILRDTWRLIERGLGRKIKYVHILEHRKILLVIPERTGWNDSSLARIGKAFIRYYIELTSPSGNVYIYTPKELKEAYPD